MTAGIVGIAALSRKDGNESTILVIAALILSTIYLAGIDQILFRAVRFLTTF